MRFILLDKVTELQVGKRIVAEKALSLAEEYLADHFPAFPVLPGVLMVEAQVQSAAMLVRVTNDFQQSMIVLQEARNIKYKSFLKPGHIMRMEMTAKEIDESAFGSEHPSVARDCHTLALVEADRGNLEEARTCMTQAWRILTNKLGSHHTRTARSYSWLVENDPDFSETAAEPEPDTSP